MKDPDDEFCDIHQAIRAEYARRNLRRRRRRSGPAVAESRKIAYERAAQACGLFPLVGKRILDVGCFGGGWLETCCSRWQGDPSNCYGVDILADKIEEARRCYPDMHWRCIPASEMDYDDAFFDIVHQSMMFSSILDGRLRQRVAEQMWRVLRPGGCLLWYDFWINPLNPQTVPMRFKEVRRLFPAARWVYRKTITVAPPLSRLLSLINDGINVVLERARVFNTHHLILMQKPS